MVYKRKRNVKIDNGNRYVVCRPGTVDVEALEEYVPPAMDTGMEADEEKEMHLKKIIEKGIGDIPIPVIAEVDNGARAGYGKYVQGSRYINWTEDARNEYLLDDADRTFCEDAGIGEDDFMQSVMDESPVDAAVPKTLIREESTNYPAYVCFRKRVIKPNRRSRRSEELSKEKMERMWSELHILDRLCRLSAERNALELSLQDVEMEMFSNAHVLMQSCSERQRRRMSRKIFRRVGRLLKPTGAVGDVMFDRLRIRSLRRRLVEIRQKKSIGERDADVQALKRYNEVHR